MEDSTKPEVAQEIPSFLRIYKDGTVERLMGTDVVPPSSSDSNTTINAQSKDVVYSQELNLSSRLYLPKNTCSDQKLPLLVYYHGGGFVIETPFSPRYHNFCNNLSSEANIIIVSVDYRRAPEHHLPAAYDDSWSVLKWVASHSYGDGPEEWINRHADLRRVFLGGDSAGGNIVHNIAMKYGEKKDKLAEINIVGCVLIHPYFWGKESIGNEVKEAQVRSKIDSFWFFAYPTSIGCDDPSLNPAADPKFGNLGCSKVLIFVAEKDFLRDRGWYYYENLKKNGWKGDIRIVEAKDENHVFHLFNPDEENAKAMLQDIKSFINSIPINLESSQILTSTSSISSIVCGTNNL